MYLDSAIIVKLLVRETDSEWFSERLKGQKFVTSELALTEVQSALFSKERGGSITSRERTAATDKFKSMIEEEYIQLLDLDRAVLERATAIQQACHPHIPLSTLDALHVAKCDLHQGGELSTTDARMRSACQQLGIALLPETINT